VKSVNFQSLDTLLSSDVSFFINIPFVEALQIISSKLHNDGTIMEWSVLQLKAIMELLKVCLGTTHFLQMISSSKLHDDMDMGSSPSPTISNNYMEHFVKLAPNSAQHKPLLWLHYIKDTSVVWPHSAELLQSIISHEWFKVFHPVHYGNRVRQCFFSLKF
jgi:hypothetical protein